VAHRKKLKKRRPFEETTPAETEGGNRPDEEGESDSEEQSQLEEFEDPLVEEKQKDQAAAEAGLIQVH
jgi:dipeptidase